MRHPVAPGRVVESLAEAVQLSPGRVDALRPPKLMKKMKMLKVVMIGEAQGSTHSAFGDGRGWASPNAEYREREAACCAYLRTRLLRPQGGARPAGRGPARGSRRTAAWIGESDGGSVAPPSFVSSRSTHEGAGASSRSTSAPERSLGKTRSGLTRY